MTYVQPAFRGELWFCSNMSPAEFHMANVLFPTSEHAYVWHMLENPTESLLWLTPQEAKRFGRSHPRRTMTDAEKLNTMARILMAKFHQNPELGDLLINTGDDPLVEVNGWHDNFWGDCHCGRYDCLPTGSNYLGRMLMAIRSSL